MLTDETKVTLEEYMQMPIGAPYQYINGCLIDWPSRTSIHQLTLGNVIMAFLNYKDQTHNEGTFLMGPIETILDNQNSFQPDFVYISKDRSAIVKDYIYGAPDIVVEILWEKNAYYDLRPKKDTYEKHGVKEYIVIDPPALNADISTLKNNVYHLHQKVEKPGKLNSLVLPGLTFDLDDIFNFRGLNFKSPS
jgi:Uma2 family endonuclease